MKEKDIESSKQIIVQNKEIIEQPKLTNINDPKYAHSEGKKGNERRAE